MAEEIIPDKPALAFSRIWLEWSLTRSPTKSAKRFCIV
jgi:hypothetical protein